MARAGQLYFLAMANLGDEPGVEVTPQRLADGGFRLLIQSSRVESTIAQIRGRARLAEHALAAPDVLHCDRWEWVDALRAAVRRLSERANTAEHTTTNLAPPSHFTVAGASISRQYDGIGEVSAVATVPNPNLPSPDCVPQPVLDAVGGLGLNVLGSPQLRVLKGGNA